MTIRQRRVYELMMAGETHAEIGLRFGMARSSVTDMLRRARRRNPSLPSRERTGRRRHCQLSQCHLPM